MAKVQLAAVLFSTVAMIVLSSAVPMDEALEPIDPHGQGLPQSKVPLNGDEDVESMEEVLDNAGVASKESDIVGERKSIHVASRLKVIFEYNNDFSQPITVNIKWVKGSKTLNSEQKIIEATHNMEIAIGTKFQIYNVETDVNVKYGHTSRTQHVSMTQAEVYSSFEVSTTVTVPPRSRLIRWQLVNDIAGHEIGYDYIVDTSSTDINEVLNGTSVIVVPKEIRLASTPFRIVHEKKNKFMTVVIRKDWPAATLGESTQYYFLLHRDWYGRFRVQTLNTTHRGYDIMYSSSHGGIYFDQWSDNEKQLWTISKAAPFYEGDVVTFKNVLWPLSGLCYYAGPQTNVYCLDQEEDRWILKI